MAESVVGIGVRRPVAGASVIDIRGDVTAAAESALMDAYQQANAERPRTVVLNFTEMAYMNSTGIGLLVTLLIRANREGQRMVAVGLNEHYRHIFQLTRLDEAIRLCDTEAQALAPAPAPGRS